MLNVFTARVHHNMRLMVHSVAARRSTEDFKEYLCGISEMAFIMSSDPHLRLPRTLRAVQRRGLHAAGGVVRRCCSAPRHRQTGKASTESSSLRVSRRVGFHRFVWTFGTVEGSGRSDEVRRSDPCLLDQAASSK